MEWLDPIRDLIHPHQAKLLSARLPSVHFQIKSIEPSRGNFFFPASKTVAKILAGGEVIGLVDYGINPLGDRLYINKIDVHPDRQRCGYALSTLWSLHLEHGLPIVPISIYGTAYPFWEAVRQQFNAAGARIEDELRTAELDQEKRRWQHLVPELDHLARIREIEASSEWPAIQAEWAAREQS